MSLEDPFPVVARDIISIMVDAMGTLVGGFLWALGVDFAVMEPGGQ